MAVVLLSEAVPKRYVVGAVRIPTATAIAKRSIGTSPRMATETSAWAYNAFVDCSVLSGSSREGFPPSKCRRQDVAVRSKKSQ